jgi:acetophenone carboxylase
MPYTVVVGGDFLELMRSGDKRIPCSTADVVRERIAQGEYLINRENIPPDFLPEGSFYNAGAEGGCGYGDVLERDPQSVVDDVRVGIVSDWAARNIYHIAYDPETWTVEQEKTDELRQEERENRLGRSRSYGEFEEEWLKKMPDADLDYYGSWPDARPVRPIIRV